MDKERDSGFPVPPQTGQVADVSWRWKPGELPPLEFNPFSPRLFEVLNRRIPAYYELMNPPPDLSAETNALRTGKLSAEPLPLNDYAGEKEMPEVSAMFLSTNHRRD